MAKVSEMIESKYLKQSDIDDDTLVTIEKVGKANVAKEGDEPEHKWLIKFAEFPKLMVLNATNIKRLARACGDDTDDWKGKQVVLYVDPDVEFGGQVVGGLRVRQAKPIQAKKSQPRDDRPPTFEQLDDSIPF